MEEQAINFRFALVLLWIGLCALQYGFHISALNSSQASLTCKSLELLRVKSGFLGLKTCVEMTNFGFGVLTSVYTLGGLCSSLQAGRLADAKGRRATALYAAVLVILGTGVMSFSSSLGMLVIGRFIVGLSAGISTVLVPLYFSEVAPARIRGSVGVITQLSICFGILVAQSISIPLSEPQTGKWRMITMVSAAFALVQVVTSPWMPESPKWLESKEKHPDSLAEEEQEPLAGGNITEQDSFVERQRQHEKNLSLQQVLISKDSSVMKGLRVVILTQAFQQGSGINAVMYYSTGILSTVSPGTAKWVALFVTFINFVMTLPSVYLIERAGRRALILVSLGAMSISSLILAYSINNDLFILASVFIVVFVAAFSIGLGPIPFVLMGEVPPSHARSATASAGLATNWSLNFVIGLVFLPLRDLLSEASSGGPGTVFYLFTGVSALGYVVIGRLMR